MVETLSNTEKQTEAWRLNKQTLYSSAAMNNLEDAQLSPPIQHPLGQF